MLAEVFQGLDIWVQKANAERVRSHLLLYRKCHIKVIGQMALIEANLDIELASTADVDVYADFEYAIQKKFEELLAAHQKILDPVGHEAWMPQETEFELIYSGDLVQGYIAKPEYVLIAKALKAPKKNRSIIVDYLASGPSALFLDLSKKYKVILEDFL